MPLYHILPILCSKRIKPLLLQLSASKTTEEALIGLTRVTVVVYYEDFIFLEH